MCYFQLNYQLKRGMQLAAAALDVSVWNCGSIVGENCMIGMVNIPLRRLNNAPNDRKGVKTLESWFQLSGPTHRWICMFFAFPTFLIFICR